MTRHTLEEALVYLFHAKTDCLEISFIWFPIWTSADVANILQMLVWAVHMMKSWSFEKGREIPCNACSSLNAYHAEYTGRVSLSTKMGSSMPTIPILEPFSPLEYRLCRNTHPRAVDSWSSDTMVKHVCKTLHKMTKVIFLHITRFGYPSKYRVIFRFVCYLAIIIVPTMPTPASIKQLQWYLATNFVPK